MNYSTKIWKLVYYVMIKKTCNTFCSNKGSLLQWLVTTSLFIGLGQRGQVVLNSIWAICGYLVGIYATNCALVCEAFHVILIDLVQHHLNFANKKLEDVHLPIDLLTINQKDKDVYK